MAAAELPFSYVHLRAHHRRYGWAPEAARDAVIGLVTNGYLPRGRQDGAGCWPAPG